MFGRKTAKVKVLKHLNTSSITWCNEAVLILVTNGMDALAVHRKDEKDNYYGSISYTTLELNNVPLIQARLPGCPTCAGMLATGYGIETSNSDELKEISERLNSDYVDITTSVDALSPLLGLLASGLYVIADAIMYPTDGNGHFFWNVPNQLSENPTTALAFAEDYALLGGVSAFLYPSQSNERFDEQRVQFYKERFTQPGHWPRAISYHFAEFLSILLDGHHKVTAAALLGENARCIDIIPMSAMSYTPEGRALQNISELYFSGFKIAANDIPNSILTPLKQTFGKELTNESISYTPTNLISKHWGSEYIDTIKYFPNLSELVEGTLLEINNISNELITECLLNQSAENSRKLRYIINSLARKGDERLKGLALKCGRLNADPILMEISFKVLTQIKGDSDVESFFIDYLIEHNDKHDILVKIADAYWS